MNRVAQMIQKATDTAYTSVSMESIASDIDTHSEGVFELSMEQETLTTLADTLGTIVVSAESLAEDDVRGHSAMRAQATACLKLAGLKEADVANILPSMEADGVRTGWERFKAFLRKLWDFIVTAAKKIYDVVDKVLKSSSVAEKMAMAQLREVRRELAARRNGLSVSATIPLRPAHRYLLSPEGELVGMAGLRTNIKRYQAQRDVMQKKLPALIERVCENLHNATDKLNVLGDDAVVSASVEANMETVLAAVRPMFPAYLAKELGAVDFKIPLIYDRAIEINNPDTSEYDLETPQGAGQYVAKLGTDVVQLDLPVDLEKLGTFPALRIVEIEEILKLCADLLEASQSTDQRRQWNRITRHTRALGIDLTAVINTVLKRENLTREAQTGLRLILSAKQAAVKWSAAPYAQVNAVNVRVVQSLLHLASDQLKNYEIKDTIEERLKADKDGSKASGNEKKKA